MGASTFELPTWTHYPSRPYASLSRNLTSLWLSMASKAICDASMVTSDSNLLALAFWLSYGPELSWVQHGQVAYIASRNRTWRMKEGSGLPLGILCKLWYKSYHLLTQPAADRNSKSSTLPLLGLHIMQTTRNSLQLILLFQVRTSCQWSCVNNEITLCAPWTIDALFVFIWMTGIYKGRALSLLIISQPSRMGLAQMSFQNEPTSTH